MGRTLQIINEKEELVCYVQKSVKALIQEVNSGFRCQLTFGLAAAKLATFAVAAVQALTGLTHAVASDVVQALLEGPSILLLHRRHQSS